MISNGFDERFEEFTVPEKVVPMIFSAEDGFSAARLDGKICQNPDWWIHHRRSSATFAVEVKVCTTPVFLEAKSKQIQARHGVRIEPLDLLMLTAKHVKHYKSFTSKTGIPVYLLYISTWQHGLVFFDNLGYMALYSADTAVGAQSIRGVQTEKVYASASAMRSLEAGLAALSAETGCPDLSQRAEDIIHEVLQLECVRQVTYPEALAGAAEKAAELVTAQSFYCPAGGRWRRAAG